MVIVMKIKSGVYEGVYWALAVLPLLVTAAVYPTLPHVVPMHFGANGAVDRYGGRAELLILAASFTLVVALFRLFFVAIDKGTEGRSSKLLRAAGIVVAGTFAVIGVAVLMMVYHAAKGGAEPDIFRVVAVLLGLGDLVLANYLPKCRPNGWSGIRTSWTLGSDHVWYQTHRFGGKLVAAGGVVSIAAALLLHGLASLLAVAAVEAAMFAALVIGSFLIAKKEAARSE